MQFLSCYLVLVKTISEHGMSKLCNLNWLLWNGYYLMAANCKYTVHSIRKWKTLNGRLGPRTGELHELMVQTPVELSSAFCLCLKPHSWAPSTWGVLWKWLTEKEKRQVLFRTGLHGMPTRGHLWFRKLSMTQINKTTCHVKLYIHLFQLPGSCSISLSTKWPCTHGWKQCKDFTTWSSPYQDELTTTADGQQQRSAPSPENGAILLNGEESLVIYLMAGWLNSTFTILKGATACPNRDRLHSGSGFACSAQSTSASTTISNLIECVTHCCATQRSHPFWGWMFGTGGSSPPFLPEK